MRPFAVLDSETDPFKRGRIPRPFVWGFFDGLKFVHYHHDSLPDLIKWLSGQKLIVYAHNGGKFDYHFMLDYMEPFDSVKIINGRIASFYIGECEFRDSFNILPVALKKFELVDESGRIVKKQDFDYTRMEEEERYKPENWDGIIDYLRDDCITLYRAIEAFQNEYGRHLTQAGAAMAQWRKIDKNKPPRSTGEFFNHFKEFYYGGRVQCFQSGIIEKDFSVFDINSAYPFAMLSEEHPYGLSHSENTFESELPARKHDIIGSGFYRIRAKARGAFPFRTPTGLSFPEDGEIREYTVSGWELRAAVETETDGEACILAETLFHEVKSFSEYISYFYEKRLNAKASGDKAGDLFAKLLMNSLYGKFGANPENYANYLVLPESEMESLLDPNNDYDISGQLGPWILAERELDDDEMRYFNVATAASITGFVRAYLWRAICKTGRDNILYCDTDSIATLSTGNELDTGKELGKWKHEGEFDRAGIAGKKMYIFRGKKSKNGVREYKTASKGVKLSNNQLWKVAGGKEVVYEPENPSFSVHSPPRFVDRRIRLTK